MTDVLNDLDTPSDAELISRVRGGDVAAYGDLFARHKDAAQRLARQLVRGPDSDDLVSEAFAKVLSVLQSGGGPDVAFRAYLLTAVRRLHVDRVRSGQRLQTTDDLTPFDPGVPFQDTAVAGFESGAAAKAFASLPERWQLVLWHLEVEGQKPADIAPLLGMSANSVSALAYRAREGLRQAFLTMHISDITETDCRWVNEHLGAYVRKGLSKRDAAKVQQHLDGCRRCTAMYLELNEVNSNLAGIIAPLLLGAAATGYLASTGVGAAGLLGVVGRVKEFVAANTGAVAAGGVGAAVVAAAVTAIAVGGNGGGKPDVNADVPASITTNVAPSTSPASPSTSPSASASASLSPSPSPSLSLSPSPSSSVSALLPSTSPTDLASGETPTDTIAPPPPPLDLTGTSISDNGVNLVATADPLPPVLTVDLVSQPSGVVFSDTGACTKVSPTQAQCLTGSGAVGAGLPGQAVLTAASTFSTTLSFDQTQGPGNADVSISVNGQAASGAPHAFSRNVDVHFGLAQAASRPNDDGDSYSVDGSLSVDGPRAADVTGIRYSVSGGTFGNGETDVVRGADVANPSFTVVPDSQSDPNVHISASPQPAFNDTDSGNDRDQANLRPYDLRVVSLAPETPTANGDDDQTFSATVDLDRFPNPGAIGLDVTVPDGDKHGTPVLSGHTVTFTVNGEVRGDVNLDVLLPARFTDANQADNDAAHPPEFVPYRFGVDVDLSDFAKPEVLHPSDPDDRYTLSGPAHVSGPAADELDTITYQITGAVFDDPFATGGGTTLTLPAYERNPSFTVVPDDPADPGTATLTAVVTGDFVETDPADNSADITLARYDVRVPEVTATESSADRHDRQRFTATIDDDGFPGHLVLIPEVPDGDTASNVVRYGNTVTFTVTGEVPGDVNLAADLPEGFTDAHHANNRAAVPARFTPHDFGVDVHLRGFDDRVRPAENDRYTVTGTVDVTGPAADELEEIRYAVSGGEFGTGQASVVLPASERNLSFVVVPGDTRDPQVRLTAEPVDPWHDSTPASVRLDLAPYDVRVDDLQAVDPVADSKRSQRFTATLGTDGWPTPQDLDLTVSVPRGDTTTAPTLQADGTVTFTVTGTASGDVTLTASLPDGWTDASGLNNQAMAAFIPHDFGLDVALDGFPTEVVHPGADDHYRFSGHVSVTGPASGELTTLTYLVTGGRFVGADEGSDGRKITLPVTDHNPDFTVVPDTPRSPGTVRVQPTDLGDYVDTDPDNDVASVDLARYDAKVFSLASDQPTADRANNQRFVAQVDDGGFPGELGLRVQAPADDKVSGLTRTGDQVTFTVTGRTAGDVALEISLPEGWTDANDGDNQSLAPFTPHDFGVDVALSGYPAGVTHPSTNDRYLVSGHTSVTGPAAGEVDTITYRLTGATFDSLFAKEGGRALTLSAQAMDPSFTLLPDDPAAPHGVTLTATADGEDYVDTDPSDNAVPLQLARFDVRVLSVDPDSSSADESGTQSFTATIDDDGFGSGLLLTASGPDGDKVGEPVRAGDKIVFTVSGKVAGPVSLRASLPQGYTDANASDNTGSSTFTPKPAEPLAFAANPRATRSDGNDWGVRATLTGAQAGTPIRITLESPSTFDSADTTGCTIGDGGTSMTCTPPQDGSFTVDFRAKLPGLNGKQHIDIAATRASQPPSTATSEIVEHDD